MLRLLRIGRGILYRRAIACNAACFMTPASLLLSLATDKTAAASWRRAACITDSLPKLPAMSRQASSNAWCMTFRDCGPNEASSISGRAFMVCSHCCCSSTPRTQLKQSRGTMMAECAKTPERTRPRLRSPSMSRLRTAMLQIAALLALVVTNSSAAWLTAGPRSRPHCKNFRYPVGRTDAQRRWSPSLMSPVQGRGRILRKTAEFILPDRKRRILGRVGDQPSSEWIWVGERTWMHERQQWLEGYVWMDQNIGPLATDIRG
jgi:hypothetical protein